MKEINREILLEGLSDLPTHSPPKDVWDNIETMIFTMPTDMLPVHKPNAGTWEAISSSLRSNTSSRNKIIAGLIISMLLLLSGSMYLWNSSTNENDNFNTENHKSIIIADRDNKDSAETDNKQSETMDAISTNSLGGIGNDVELSADPITNNDNVIKSGDFDQSETVNEPSDNEPIISIEESNPDFEIFLIQSRLFGRYNSKVQGYQPVIGNNKELATHIDGPHPVAKSPDYCSFNRIEKSIMAGLGLSYQQFLSNSIPDDTRIQYWFTTDAVVLFTRERFLFETGFGIGLSYDKTEFTYDYKTNEIVNTYEYVDSVHYDPVTGLTEYFTTTVEVWDSVDYSSSAYQSNNYVYAGIPIKLGYIFLKNRNFCSSIIIGGNYYFEVSKQRSLPDLYHENSIITHVNNVAAVRRTQFYNMEAGIRFGWKINENLLFNLDPTFRYYPVNIYKGIDNGNYAFSFRAGFYIKF